MAPGFPCLPPVASLVPLVCKQVFGVEPRVVKLYELAVPVDVLAKLRHQAVVMHRWLGPGYLRELPPRRARPDALVAVEVLRTWVAPPRPYEDAQDDPAHEYVVHVAGVLGALAEEPGVQVLQLPAFVRPRVPLNVLVVLPSVLGQVRAVPEEATAEPLIQAVLQERQDAPGLRPMQQHRLVHLLQGLAGQAAERALEDAADLQLGEGELPLLDVLQYALALDAVALPEAGVLHPPGPPQDKLLVAAAFEDVAAKPQVRAIGRQGRLQRGKRGVLLRDWHHNPALRWKARRGPVRREVFAVAFGLLRQRLRRLCLHCGFHEGLHLLDGACEKRKQLLRQLLAQLHVQIPPL
mmetsp:Transcript_103907/g.320498  ORF Transcript_103907/g.320498 Transcript_103907/m.320498 type:complete len:351 (+) Transcript_103907:171-1223(+)